MPEKATLFVFAAPSGGGKTSLVKAIVNELSDIEVSISHTTRPKREGETEGRHYHFVDDSQFKHMLDTHQFIESAEVFGSQYGTSRRQIEEKLSKGTDVLLDIDWQGARQLKALFNNVVSIFIIPPSVAALKERLHKRAQDDDNVIAYRMEKARSEISHYQEFDYLIVNDDFDKAFLELKQIIFAERLKNPIQSIKHQSLLSNLLMSK